MYLDEGVTVKGKTNFSSSYEANILKVTANDVEFGSNDPYNTFTSFRVYVPSAGSGASDGKIDIYGGTSAYPFVHFQEDGKIGINNTSPTATLDVAGTLKLVDGTQGLNKVLTSDASGNASWQSLSSGTDWALTGNTGTTPGTNFIGTIDSKNLDFRTNNSIRARLTTKGQLEIINSAFSVWIGDNSGAAITTGTNNTFLGYHSGQAVSAGYNNTALGCLSMQAATTGTYNTGVGMYALYGLTNGNYNVSLGDASGSGLSSGNNNVFVGTAAGDNVTTGSTNIVIGDHIDAPVSTGNYQMTIGNLIFGTNVDGTASTISTGNIGIGNNAPSYKLDVNGTFRSGNPGTDGQLNIYSEQGATDYLYTISPNSAATQNVVLTLPPNDGNANDVLVSDGSGNLSWSAPGSSTGWALTGNTGLNDPAAPATYGTSTFAAGENFIGTTDAQDVVFGTNLAERMRIKQTTGNVGIGTATPTELFQVYKSANADKSAIYSYVNQTTTAADYQNRAVLGMAKGGNSNWGYAVGVAGVADQAGSYFSTGVYAALGTSAPSSIQYDQALYADGANLGSAGIFMTGNVGIGNALPVTTSEA
jgi:hypothetical protein